MDAAQDDAPLWRVIADQLRADIGNEVYAPGAALPGETAMAARYQTSRPTVRRAIFELAGEGLLSAAQGRGTFVRPRPDRRPIAIGGTQHPDLLDDEYDAQRAGWIRDEHPDAARYRAVHRGVTDAIITGATRDQAEALRISTGDLVLYRFQHWRHRQTQRVISVTSISPAHFTGPLGRPHVPEPDYPEDYPPHDLSRYDQDPPEPADLPEPDDDDEAEPIRLYDLLAKHGPVSFTTGINARMPRGDELNDLGTEPGIPLLQIKRTMTDPHGRPLEVTIIEAPADRIEAQNAGLQGRTPAALLAI